MTRMNKAECVVKTCAVLPSEVLSVGIDQCNDMLKFISTMNEIIDELIENLHQAVEAAETLRRNILISKTSGVVAASVGTTLNVIGLILIPFTAGISVPILCGTGTALAVSGTVTNIGTTLAEIPIKKGQSEKITGLLYKFKESLDRYERNTDKLKVALRVCNESEFQFIGGIFKRKRQLEVTKWLQAGYLHKDEDVEDNKDLRQGDHIFRSIRASRGQKHHGIYIGEHMVVELILDGVKSRSLKDFTEHQPLKRRKYGGYDIKAVETVDLAMKALNGHPSLHQYSLLTNNCEHFATSLKLKIRWSGQVDSALTTTSEVFKNINRPLSLIVEGVEVGAQITAALAPKTILSFFNSFSTPVLSGLAKAAIVLAPISVALDITSLVFEYKKENTSAHMCNETLKKLDELKSDLQVHGEVLKVQIKVLNERRCKAKLFEEEVRRIEAKRIADEREELERLEAKKPFMKRIQERIHELIVSLRKRSCLFVKRTERGFIIEIAVIVIVSCLIFHLLQYYKM